MRDGRPSGLALTPQHCRWYSRYWEHKYSHRPVHQKGSMTLTVSPFGEQGIILHDVERPLDAASQLTAAFPDVRIRPGIDTIVITGETLPSRDALSSVLSHMPSEAPATGSPIIIPVRYTGEDLATVARDLELASADVIAAHTETLWRVALIGFAPGFPYLIPVNSENSIFARIPRLASPRKQVPSGSVAIAAGMSCIYPSALPGGWNLIGTTDLQLFNAGDDSHPSALVPGDIVQFQQVTR